MKREYAIAVLKEIVKVCKVAAVSQISLKPVTESQGYELHIQDHFDENDCEDLDKIIQKHNLAMRKNNGTIIIYNPKPS